MLAHLWIYARFTGLRSRKACVFVFLERLQALARTCCLEKRYAVQVVYFVLQATSEEAIALDDPFFAFKVKVLYACPWFALDRNADARA